MKPNDPARNPERASNPTEANFTIKSLAAAERVSVMTIRREITAGRLVAVKIGRLTRITPEDRQAWKASLPRLGRAA